MAKVEKLSVALTPELAEEVRGAIAKGEYASTSEVVRDALRSWKHAREVRAAALDELRHLWRDGVESGTAGPLYAEDVKRRGRKRLTASRTQDS